MSDRDDRGDSLIQTANALRFQILNHLGEDGADLVRDFEIALNAERATQISNEDDWHTDKRSIAIAAAEKKIAIIKHALSTATAEQLFSITTSLAEVVAERDAALLMPEHVYECWECDEETEFVEFQSAARKVLWLAGETDHDETGIVIKSQRYRPPIPMVLCPGCKDKMHVKEYLGQRRDRDRRPRGERPRRAVAIRE